MGSALNDKINILEASEYFTQIVINLDSRKKNKLEENVLTMFVIYKLDKSEY